jgi:catechol 2,3-dioxygenase-like lactoylglutathione lyase family enzyme
MKFLAIDLYTNDPVRTRAFYTQQLGLPIVSESPSHLTLRIGWTHLTFWAVNVPVAPYHLAINVPRGALEVCMYYYGFDYLDTQATGQTVAEFPDWNARASYFYDNNGNLLEFIGRANLPLDDPNLTINDLFQGVSEVGIATEDVTLTTCRLAAQYGIEQFSRSVPKTDFNAVGNDDGLFILSRVGRKWLFSETEAQLNYCRVVFLNEPTGQVHTLHSYEVNRIPTGYISAL